MNYNHVENADRVEFSRLPDFQDQGDQHTKRPVNQLKGSLLIDIEFITSVMCDKVIYIGDAPSYLSYIIKLFPDIKFHIYDDYDGPGIVYNRPFDSQDAKHWSTLDNVAVNFYHSKSPDCYEWWQAMAPATALFRYGPYIPHGEIVRVPFGDCRIGDGLAVFVFGPSRPIKYISYTPPAQTCEIDGVDIYASSNVARVSADNCYECYAARDIISEYLLFTKQEDRAETRYEMLDFLNTLILKLDVLK